MKLAKLLVELLTEELPPKALNRLGEAFADALAAGLRQRKFVAEDAEVVAYATPRRLAVTISNVLAVAPDADVTEKLMPAKVARDAAGGVSEALKKKLGALGRAHLATSTLDAADGPDRVFVQSDGKADYVYLSSLAKGQSLQHGLQAALADAIAKLPIPKVMSYAGPGSYYNDQKFVRPAHRLVALHGTEVIPVAALGLSSGRTTAGHRFLSREDIAIASADAYEPTLEAEGKVVASFGKRRAAIVTELETAAAGATIIMPDALLDEVTAMVESPKVLTGGFNADFLAVPQECLILTMQQNQKYFALAGSDGRLQNRFLLVTNLATHDPSAIIRGNERVLRARLADAKFFFDQDRKTRLADRVPRLASIVYHNKLGSQLDRVERVRAIAKAIAPKVGADTPLAERAALLAKADLVTDMVGEFPELQGTMGRYYALDGGEPSEVADAIAQHYRPRFAGDSLPQGPVAIAVSLADKIETIVGMIGIGNVPTGDKDPYGLRRAALGIIRILGEERLPLSLFHLCEVAQQQFKGAAFDPAAMIEAHAFLVERLRGYLRDSGASALEVAAVLDQHRARTDLQVPEIQKMVAEVVKFNKLDEARELAAMNKRVLNIIAKNNEEIGVMFQFDETLLVMPAEKALYQQMNEIKAKLDRDWDNRDYGAYLHTLLRLKSNLARFFDKDTGVLVMDPDTQIRGNRAALLQKLGLMLNKVANISKLAV